MIVDETAALIYHRFLGISGNFHSALQIAGLLASEEQKRELLPDMAALKLIGAWGLTEPSNGSDAAALQTTARKVRSHLGVPSDICLCAVVLSARSAEGSPV